MKDLWMVKEDFNPLFPYWLKNIVYNKLVPVVFLVLMLISSLELFIFDSLVTPWIFAVIAFIYFLLVVGSLICAIADNYRIWRICRKNGWTIEEWNNEEA